MDLFGTMLPVAIKLQGNIVAFIPCIPETCLDTSPDPQVNRQVDDLSQAGLAGNTARIVGRAIVDHQHIPGIVLNVKLPDHIPDIFRFIVGWNDDQNRGQQLIIYSIA